MLDFFEAVLAKQNDAVLTILTGNTELAHALVKKRKLSARSVRIRRMPPGEVPHYLASADLGLALREPSFSQRGVCPIKLAEYLLCGLPVVATAGVGDTDHQIDAGVGYVIEDLDCVNWETVVEHFFETILPNRDAFRERCRARGLEHFDIENVARSFREIILKVV
jgi:glycosyltransferase involved in cell wall biosynthesis